MKVKTDFVVRKGCEACFVGGVSPNTHPVFVTHHGRYTAIQPVLGATPISDFQKKDLVLLFYRSFFMQPLLLLVLFIKGLEKSGKNIS